MAINFANIDPNLNFFDFQIAVADEFVREWMSDPDNYEELKQLKAKYLHNKGWSVSRVDGTKGNFKHEFNIPEKAFFALPPTLRNNPEEVRKWVKTRHPYLMFKN